MWLGGRALRAIALVAMVLAGAFPALSKPQRIVSLNLCTDQLLLDLVPRERIAALSFLAADPTMSPRVADAKDIPLVQGAAEEVLAFDPDLILAGEYSTPATVGMLERLGRRVVKVPMASSFEEIRAAVRLMAEAVGETEKGGAIISDFDRRLAAAKTPEGGAHPTVVAMQVNSLASGPGSMLDEVFAAAGYHNMTRDAAAQGKLGPAGRLPLETLLLWPPDLIVLANAPGDFRTVLGDNLRHPAFQQLLRERPSMHLPMSSWLCGTPAVAEAVEKLAAQRASLSPPLESAP